MHNRLGRVATGCRSRSPGSSSPGSSTCTASTIRANDGSRSSRRTSCGGARQRPWRWSSSSASNELGAFESGGPSPGSSARRRAFVCRRPAVTVGLALSTTEAVPGARAPHGAARGSEPEACVGSEHGTPSTGRRSGRTTRRGEPGDFYYSRYNSPTVAAAEARLGRAGRRATALLYPSGSGADDVARASACSRPATRSRSRRAATSAPAVHVPRRSSAGASATSSSTQTGPPPDGRAARSGSRRRRTPFLTMPDLEAAAAHPAPVVVDRNCRNARVPASPSKHGARLRPALGDEVPRRPRRRRCSASSSSARDPAAADALRTFRTEIRHRRRRRPCVGSSCGGLKTLEIRVAQADGDRGVPRRASCGRIQRLQVVPLPGLRRTDQLRRRRRGRPHAASRPRPRLIVNATVARPA